MCLRAVRRMAITRRWRARRQRREQPRERGDDVLTHRGHFGRGEHPHHGHWQGIFDAATQPGTDFFRWVFAAASGADPRPVNGSWRLGSWRKLPGAWQSG